MVPRRPFPLPQRACQDDGETGTSTWVSTLACRSRAVVVPSPHELQLMVNDARARNRVEGVTGMMVYDEGRFLQWLEGPGEAVERVWNSVRHDTRHEAVELLGRHAAPVRFFAEHALKLCVRTTPSARTPEPADQPVRLARLLLSPDHLQAAELVQQSAARCAAVDAMCDSLFEPTARHLGDLWQDDECSEFDVALALGRLQACWRALRADATRVPIVDAPPLLVAPCPGESHMLGAALHADVLWQAGWDAQVEFPKNDDALARLVGGTWFGALDLTLSAAFRREHWLPRLTTTIARARAASCNRSLVVLVGGRVFDGSEGHPDACTQVGADAVCASGSQIESTLVRQMAGVHGATGSTRPTPHDERAVAGSKARLNFRAAGDPAH